MTLVIAVCALVGAIAGIAGSAAAPSKSSKSAQAKKQAKKQARQLKRGFRMRFRGGPGPGPGFLFGPVHDEAVIPKRDGSGFLTITSDSGTLNNVDNTTVHIKEGTAKATYDPDKAVDVGDSAKVIRDGADAKLGDLKAGDHVRVIVGAPKGNIVIAADDAWLAQRQKDHDGRHHFGFGPDGPPPGPGAPPPPDGSNENGSSTGADSGGSNS